MKSYRVLEHLVEDRQYFTVDYRDEGSTYWQKVMEEKKYGVLHVSGGEMCIREFDSLELAKDYISDQLKVNGVKVYEYNG